MSKEERQEGQIYTNILVLEIDSMGGSRAGYSQIIALGSSKNVKMCFVKYSYTNLIYRVTLLVT